MNSPSFPRAIFRNIIARRDNNLFHRTSRHIAASPLSVHRALRFVMSMNLADGQPSKGGYEQAEIDTARDLRIFHVAICSCRTSVIVSDGAGRSRSAEGPGRQDATEGTATGRTTAGPSCAAESRTATTAQACAASGSEGSTSASASGTAGTCGPSRAASTRSPCRAAAASASARRTCASNSTRGCASTAASG